jgi:hypothetical protein
LRAGRLIVIVPALAGRTKREIRDQDVQGRKCLRKIRPLLLGKGVGTEMRVALGTAVFSGMLGVTIFAIFFTPVFYSVVMWFGGSRHERAD